MSINRPSQVEAIKRFLCARPEMPPDFAERYHPGMEVQVIVGQDGGTLYEATTFQGRQWQAWEGAEGQRWYPIRIPKDANTEPTYKLDKEMSYDLAAHAAGIGMTGWNWQDRVSEWVGFDFDAISGHSERNTKKLTETELAEIAGLAKSVSWIQVRRSTSGKGLHLYAYIDRFPTANHTEHAAIGRAILANLSGVVGFDFQAKADQCGGNMWVWHRKMLGTNGLTVIKEHFGFAPVPENWRDHLNVVKGVRKKNLPLFVDDQREDNKDAEAIFERITGQRLIVPLDDEHKRLLEYLRENNCRAWWDSDHHMLVTHTWHLKEAHDALGFKGIFRTIAQGTERGADHNVFCFPMAKGGWTVRRYTPGTAEDETWDRDQSGYTRCYYNRLPDLESAARANAGIERAVGGFAFSSVEPAAATVEMLGGKLLVPQRVGMDRAIQVKSHREDGKVIVEMEKIESDKDLNVFKELRWALEGKKWKTVIPVRFIPNEEATTLNCDDSIRHIVTPAGNDAGWIIKSEEQWRAEPLKHVQAVLSTEHGGKQITGIIGSLVLRPWTIVALPFQPEYPGDRTWNRNAPQLAFPPAPEKDPTAYPTWDKLLRHLGKGLDSAIAEDGWCKANMVYTGADYLKIWIASVIQYPMEQLPYLFLYSSEEDTGKSTFHEAFSMLVTRGVESADNALINVQGFNGELENSVLCVIEETNLSASKVALNRIKAWVTAKMLPVHPKHGKPYSIPNTTHWIQLSNEINACPILPGDTRITMIPVSQITLDEMIPKRRLLELLRKEAPAFLRAIIELEIPQSNDRLNLPVVTTQEKVQMQVMNETLIETFLRESIYHIPGHMIKVSEMWKVFYEWLEEGERDSWSKIRMGKEIKQATSRYPKGRNPRDAEYYYANCSLTPWKMGDPKLPELILEGEKLVPIRGVKHVS